MSISKYDNKKIKSSFCVKWTVGKKRHSKCFRTQSLRNEFYDKLVRQKKREGERILELSSSDASIMAKCKELLGSSEKVLEACIKQHEACNLVDISPREAVEAFLLEKKQIGRDDNYHRAMRVILYKLIDYFPDSFRDWNEEIARKWILELTQVLSASTILSYKKKPSTFCNWCVKRNYLHSNLFLNVPTPDVIRPEPKFLTIDELKRLLAVAEEKYPETLAYFALSAFAGLRSSACCRLDINSIDFNKKGILIRADQAKNKRRVYLDGYEDNLWHWLDYARFMDSKGFELSKKQWDVLRARIAYIAGVKMPHNALRHSFCTYHVALHGDAGKTATLLTHRGNVSILYEHYKGNATREDGKAWFSLTPNDIN